MQCSFLKQCSFPSGNSSAFVQSYSVSFKTPDSYSICSVWLTLSIAAKMCNGWCSLQHSLKRKILVKGKCCLQVTICLEDKIVPWTRSTVLAKKYICGKMKYILLWSSAFLSFSFYDHFFNDRLIWGDSATKIGLQPIMEDSKTKFFLK